MLTHVSTGIAENLSRGRERSGLGTWTTGLLEGATSCYGQSVGPVKSRTLSAFDLSVFPQKSAIIGTCDGKSASHAGKSGAGFSRRPNGRPGRARLPACTALSGGSLVRSTGYLVRLAVASDTIDRPAENHLSRFAERAGHDGARDRNVSRADGHRRIGAGDHRLLAEERLEFPGGIDRRVLQSD